MDVRPYDPARDAATLQAWLAGWRMIGDVDGLPVRGVVVEEGGELRAACFLNETEQGHAEITSGIADPNMPHVERRAAFGLAVSAIGDVADRLGLVLQGFTSRPMVADLFASLGWHVSEEKYVRLVRVAGGA